MPTLEPSVTPPPSTATVAVPAVRDRSPLGLIAVAISMFVCAQVAFGAWERVRTPKPADRSIKVVGSAKKRIVSDYAEWSTTVVTENKDRTAAYRELDTQMKATLAHLQSIGMKPAEMRVSAATFQEVHETETIITGKGEKAQTKQREIMVGWRVTQSVTVASQDVATIEKASREITSLLQQGITITSSAPSYYYTKLGELKIEMLAAASKDARTRAENMIRSAGGAKLGKLRAADMGVIQVNPANSTETSWEGNNDTSSLEKDIMTIVRATYEMTN